MTDENGIPITLIDRTEVEQHKAREDFMQVLMYAAMEPMPGEIGCIVAGRVAGPVISGGRVVGFHSSGGRCIERIVVA